jgi:thioredoxin 1
MAIEINKDNYHQIVGEDPRPTVVDFWGPKCTRCIELMPKMEEIADQNKDKMRLLKVDTTGNRRLCMGLRLLSIPAFLFYREGEEVGRISGNDLSEDDLQSAVDKFLAGEEIE